MRHITGLQGRDGLQGRNGLQGRKGPILLIAAAALALAGCASSNWQQAHDSSAAATAPRARTAADPTVHTPRRSVVRRDWDADRSTETATVGSTRAATGRRTAGRSDIASDASSAVAPKPLSDEWLKLEDEKEDKLRRTMIICRGC
jgi:hypothetical protein